MFPGTAILAMSDPEQRAIGASIMEALAFPTIRSAEDHAAMIAAIIMTYRAKLRRELKRRPAEDKHLLDQKVHRRDSELTQRKLQAMVDQKMFDRRWAEVRRLCWGLRRNRAAHKLALERVERMRADRARWLRENREGASGMGLDT